MYGGGGGDATRPATTRSKERRELAIRWTVAMALLRATLVAVTPTHIYESICHTTIYCMCSASDAGISPLRRHRGRHGTREAAWHTEQKWLRLRFSINYSKRMKRDDTHLRVLVMCREPYMDGWSVSVDGWMVLYSVCAVHPLPSVLAKMLYADMVEHGTLVRYICCMKHGRWHCPAQCLCVICPRTHTRHGMWGKI